MGSHAKNVTLLLISQVKQRLKIAAAGAALPCSTSAPTTTSNRAFGSSRPAGGASGAARQAFLCLSRPRDGIFASPRNPPESLQSNKRVRSASRVLSSAIAFNKEITEQTATWILTSGSAVSRSSSSCGSNCVPPSGRDTADAGTFIVPGFMVSAGWLLLLLFEPWRLCAVHTSRRRR